MPSHADAAPTPVTRITLRSGDRVVDVDVDTIDYIETTGNYVRVHIGRAVLLHRSTLDALQRRLGHDRFVRIRRSTIVRIAAIRACEPYARGSYTVVLRNATRLRSSRYFLAQLRRIFDTP